MPCLHCGSHQLENNPVNGNLICMECGQVVTINCDTAEVEFVEESSGNKAVGKFFSDHNKNESIAVKQAKLRISWLCVAMNIPVLQDRAGNLYVSALRRGITRGRPADEVACACIYLAYRTTENPCFSLSLLDFSDHVPINVFRLGHTYLSLKQRLHVDCIHDIDPYLFVEPFARQLEFGEHTMEVCETAGLILRRMRKDWMCTGRRPAGVAASALLIAARIHQFNRTYEDVAKIARISRNTTRKRLLEFFSSDIAAETLDNLHTINDFESEQDPPCFKDGQLRAQQATELDKGEAELLEEMLELEKRINAEVEKLQQRTLPPMKLMLGGDRFSDVASCSSRDTSATKVEISQQASTSMAPPPEGWEETMAILCGNVGPATKQQKTESSEEEDHETSLFKKYTTDTVLRQTLYGVVDDQTLNEHVRDLSGVLREDTDVGFTADYGEAKVENDEETGGTQSMFERQDQQLDLTGIDDEELEREYILTKPESVAKIRSWIRDNADYLIKEKQKQEERRKKEEKEAKAPPKKKRVVQKLSRLKGNSPGEILRKAMEIRGACKIDYNAFASLEALEDLAAAPPTATTSLADAGMKDEAEEKSQLKVSTQSTSHLSQSEVEPASSLSPHPHNEEPATKKMKVALPVAPVKPAKAQSLLARATAPKPVPPVTTTTRERSSKEQIDLDEDMEEDKEVEPDELEDEETADDLDLDDMMNTQFDDDIAFTEEFL